MKASLFRLDGRAALISGASSGIGLHTARTFAAAGASVALCARRSGAIEQAAAELRAEGHRACAVTLDVTQPDTIPARWELAQQMLGQPMDILFNNAGIIYAERFVAQERAEVEKIFATNLTGAFMLAQEGGRRFSALGRGSIINIASTSGMRAGGYLSSYGASKAALIHLTRVMALELAGKGVRVNALSPGNLKTDMHATFEKKGFDQGVLRRVPMRRFGEAEDLDGAALLLASDAGAYITGAVIPVDGGQLLSWM